MKLREFGLLAAAVSVAGCAASVPRNSPDWYRAAAHEHVSGYPSLRDVPRTTAANTDAAYWARLRTDLTTASAEMRANPRSQPAGPQDPNAFVDSARADIEAARAAHE